MHMSQERVEQMLDAGVSFEEIETFIEDRVHLPREAKSALWLLAWAETSRPQRRRAVSSLIAAQTAGE